MKLERTWDLCPVKRTLNLRMVATIEGRQLQATVVASGHALMQAPPPDYLDRQLRSMILSEIEKELFR